MALPVRGVHTALVTPFLADGAVDLPTYGALVERQIDGGIDGLVACGTTGEASTLEPEEWRDVVAATVEVNRGRVPVTAGVGTNNTRSTVKNVEAAQKLGCDAALLVFPYYNKPNPDGLRAHVRAAAAPGLPLVLYHVPSRTGQKLTAALLAELAEIPGVCSVKEATGDLLFDGDLLTRTRTPVLSGDDFTFLPLLSLGGTGVISVLSNVAPADTVAIQTAFEAGRVAEAAERMRRLWALTTWLFDEVNPVRCKAAMAAMGLCRADVRLPLAASKALVPHELVAGVA
jgi:4-hydroxy-tetrahydrodipicolinate synthase